MNYDATNTHVHQQIIQCEQEAESKLTGQEMQIYRSQDMLSQAQTTDIEMYRPDKGMETMRTEQHLAEERMQSQEIQAVAWHYHVKQEVPDKQRVETEMTQLKEQQVYMHQRESQIKHTLANTNYGRTHMAR